MIEVQEGTLEVGDCVVYGYFQGCVEDLKRREVLGRGGDCQVNPAEKDLKSRDHAQASLLLAGWPLRWDREHGLISLTCDFPKAWGNQRHSRPRIRAQHRRLHDTSAASCHGSVRVDLPLVG